MKKVVKFLIPLFVIVLAVAFYFYYDYNKIKVNINGEETVTIALGEEYAEKGCSAYHKLKPIATVVSGEVDNLKVGSYLLTYTAKSGKKTEAVTRTIRVVDIVAPVITAPESVYVPVEMPLKNYRFDFSINDNYEGDITSRAVFDFSEDKIFINATDSFGNKSKKEINVIRVSDVTPPVITLSGFDTVFLQANKKFTDPGFVAIDDVDGNITHKATVAGYENLNKVGTHTITYSVVDSSNNSTVCNRTVVVYDPKPYATNSAERTVYLTFDDGPCIYTPKILDILKRYNVKATFFVTNQKADWQNYIAQAAKEGHTIAAHTYSHQYSIYRSKEAFFEDLQAINEVIKTQTGSYTRLMRFPGGSSNTISRKYSKGIMSVLSKEVTEQGYVYFDWNVNSGDADGSKNQRNPGYIAANVIKNLKNGANIVLMHDMNGANIESLPIIIEYGLANGIKFLPLTENSPTAHHSVLN